MVLGVFSDPFKSPLGSVIMKCRVLSTSFRDCVTLCQRKPNIFWLSFEGSSNDAEEHSFVEFVQRKGMSREDLVRAELRVRQLVLESQITSLSLAQGNLIAPCPAIATERSECRAVSDTWHLYLQMNELERYDNYLMITGSISAEFMARRSSDRPQKLRC
jgi:hypothetical protein